MAKKQFSVFQDVGFDSPVGGSLRLRYQRLPHPDLPQGLYNPAEGKDIEAFKEASAQKDLILDIGCGKGAFLVERAKQRKDAMCVGFETKVSYCIKTLERAKRHNVLNCICVYGDARLAIPLLVPQESASEVYILFPDPWWKKRHAERRFGARTKAIVASVLKKGGILVLKSDVAQYTEELGRVFLEGGVFEHCDVPYDLPRSSREKKVLDLGEKVFEIALKRR
jgi:tRNA (guanine-N7-)-methyltransferase